MEIADDLPLLDVSLTSNRSLNWVGQAVVVGVYALASALFGGLMIWRGYWPVAPFLGLDVLGLALAFWIVGRRRAFEDVTVGSTEIVVRKRRPGMRVQVGRLPTLWTRLEREDDPDFGLALVEEAGRHGLYDAVVRALRLSQQLFGTAIREYPTSGRLRLRPRGSDALFRRRLLARDDWGRAIRPVTRLGFYVRSHWLRMPPAMLARHLWIKWRKGRVRPAAPASERARHSHR